MRESRYRRGAEATTKNFGKGHVKVALYDERPADYLGMAFITDSNEHELATTYDGIQFSAYLSAASTNTPETLRASVLVRARMFQSEAIESPDHYN